MSLRNSKNQYGWVSISVHWLTALLVIILFTLGIYMVDLSYYDPWYHKAPYVHKSIGMIFAIIFIFRLIWHYFSVVPVPLVTNAFLRAASIIVHKLLYIIIASTLITGYLIATAKGHSISVFDFVQIPALVLLSPEQSNLVADLHEISSWTLISLALIHACAAFKHHFINKDLTLKRMLGKINK